MPYELLISATAYMEADNAYIFYENQLDGLCDRFLKSLNDAYQKLSGNPQYYSYINSRKDLRDLKIKDFPFVLIFQIVENKVLVLRVFNTNRDPRSIKNL